MAVLKQGSKGDAVSRLQQRLKELGFDPGGTDGNFGPGTKAAVIAFQKSKGLGPDGIAGPGTLSALALNGPAPANGAAGNVSASANGSVIDQVTVAIVSKMFPGTPVANIETNLPFVLEALKEAGLTDKDMVLMALGTIRAETGSFRPISEGKSRFNTSPGSHPFNLYDSRKALGNTGPPDGANFKGRGFVQLTGRSNYTKFSAELGLGDELVTHPDMANDPRTAAQLLALFIKDKETAIRNALAAHDLKKARKLVNGGSNGLKDFTAAFEIGEKLIP